MSYKNIGLVLLNKNEARALPVLLPRVDFGLFERVFVIDGGSEDESLEIFENYGLEVLQQFSKGRGEAFKLAFKYANSNKLDALVFFSCDGNEDPSDLKKFRNFLEAGSDLVIASRMMKGAHNEEDSNLFRPRKFGNKVFAWLAYLAFGRQSVRITDPINGFRAITVFAWNRMKIESEGFSVEYESSIKGYKLGLQVTEFPTYEFPRLFGNSSAKAWKTSLAMLKVLRMNVYK